jgi:hypothetical protein
MYLAATEQILNTRIEATLTHEDHVETLGEIRVQFGGMHTCYFTFDEAVKLRDKLAGAIADCLAKPSGAPDVD